MGAYLSSPKTEKESGEGTTIFGQYGFSSMQGWRKDMEDAHVVEVLDESTVMFGVFDGHGGKEVALYVAKHLPKQIAGTAEFKEGKLGHALTAAFLSIDAEILTEKAIAELKVLGDGGEDEVEVDTVDENEGGETREVDALKEEGEMDIHELLVREYGAEAAAAMWEDVDSDSDDEDEGAEDGDEDADGAAKDAGGDATMGGAVLKIERADGTVVAPFGDEGSDRGVGRSSGTTATVALLKGNSIVVANAGDTRCVLCRDGQTVPLSFDHKPEDDGEQLRIENAGGMVSAEGRIDKGDAKDEFLVLACDGIWNSMENEEVVAFVRGRLAQGLSPSLICEQLCDAYGDGTGCDNETAMIVVLAGVPAKENWAETTAM
eukprot:gene16846-13423_t